MATLGTRFARAAAWQFAGNILRVGLGLWASTLVVRWLGAEQFGQAAWILSLTMYASIIGSLGLGTPFSRGLTAVRISGDRRTAAALLRRLAALRLATVAVFGVAVLAAERLLPAGSLDPDLRSLLVFVPALLMVSYLHGMAVRVLQVFFRQGIVAGLVSVEIVVKVALVAALGGSGADARVLLVAATAAEAVVMAAGWLLVVRQVRHMEPEDAAAARPVAPSARRLLRDGRATWVISLAERVLGRDVDILLLGLLAGPVEVARYALPFSLATLSLNLAAGLYEGTTNLAAFTEAAPEARRRLLRVLFEYWLLFVVPLAVGGILLGNGLLTVLYGEAAAGSGAVTGLLFAALAVYQLAALLKDAMQGSGDDGRPTRAHLAGGGVNLALTVVLIPHFGATGAAAATLVGATITCVWQLVSLPEALRTAPSRRVVAVAALALSAMAAAVQLAGVAPGGGWLHAVSLVALGGAVYFASLGLVGPRSTLGGHLPAALPLRAVARRVL